MLVNQKLRAIADRQYGYFTTRQALSAGYDNALHVYHVKNGSWLRIDHGLYRLAQTGIGLENPQAGDAESLESEFTRWLLWAAGKSLTRVVAICHESALHYYGLQQERPAEVHLCASSVRNKPTGPGCVLHREILKPEESALYQGFRLTTPFCTLRAMQPDLVMARRWVPTVQLARQKQLIDDGQSQQLLAPVAPKEAREVVRVEVAPVLPEVFASQAQTYVSLAQTQGESQRWRSPNLRRIGGEMMRARSSFTLVEMLVVITIIMILAAIMMPSLNSALFSARLTSCKNNLRQTGVATGLYSDENNSYFVPPNFPPRLQPYGVTFGMLTCPLDTVLAVDINTVTYGVNMDNTTGAPPTYWSTSRYKLSQVAAAHRENVTVYFMDSISPYVQHIPGYAGRSKWGSARHNSKLNVLWVDGHASSADEERLADSNLDGTDDVNYFNWTVTYMSKPKVLN